MSGTTLYQRARVALVGLVLLRAAVVGAPQLPTLWQQERAGTVVAVVAFFIAAGVAIREVRRAAPSEQRPGQLGQTIVVLAVLTTLLAPLLTGHPPSHEPTPLSASPRWGYWFGTDGARRDVWTLTL